MALALTLPAISLPLGCQAAYDGSVEDAREALGTIVTITAYGEDEAGVRGAIDRAFDAILSVEAELDAYDASSAVSVFNADPFTPWPVSERLGKILSASAVYGADGAFSVGLFGVMRLYDFGGAQRVPSALELANELAAVRLIIETGGRLYFAPQQRTGAMPGLDLGGALKGLALDEAAAVLDSAPAVTAALLTAGSTTVTLGSKPDGEPWRIGVEDPRKPGRLVATIEATGSTTVSTSGDYQQYFEQDGVRYHHILDPITGRPARGLRSLTVVGAPDGLISDILSTALFVVGHDRAPAYADEMARRGAPGLALCIVDDSGQLTITSPPGAAAKIVRKANPRP